MSKNETNAAKILPPNIPENSRKEFIVYVKRGGGIVTDAFYYANRVEFISPSGLEIFTGWCRFGTNGRRLEALNEEEYVVNWKFTTEMVDGVLWTKLPIVPKIGKGEIKPYLLSWHKFGETKPRTILVYYANEYMFAKTPNHATRYHGWLAIHPFDGVKTFNTIGDKLIAWAEPPEYGRANDE